MGVILSEVKHHLCISLIMYKFLARLISDTWIENVAERNGNFRIEIKEIRGNIHGESVI